MASFSFGISLSGGGARGIAHIGVLQALHKYGLEPQIISGTSMGAIVGALYAAGHEPLEILDIIKSQKTYKVLSWRVPSSGLLSLDLIRALLSKNIKKDHFSALKKPFYIAVTNMNKGEVEIIHTGKLFQWVMASASIPIVFEPQTINGVTYVDGGLFNNLPSECIADQCEFLLGSHVNHNELSKDVRGMRKIAERTFNLAMAQNVRSSMKLCDIVIDPPKLLPYNTFDFNKADELYQIGFEETERVILQIFKSVNVEVLLQERKKLDESNNTPSLIK